MLLQGINNIILASRFSLEEDNVPTFSDECKKACENIHTGNTDG